MRMGLMVGALALVLAGAACGTEKATAEEASVASRPVRAAGLDLAVEDFRPRWNAISKSRVQGVEFDGGMSQTHLAHEQFLQLNEGTSGRIRSILVGYTPGNHVSAADFMLNIVAVVSAVQPDLAERQRGEVLKALLTDPDYKTNPSRKYTVGSVRYSLTSVEGMGILFAADPVE